MVQRAAGSEPPRARNAEATRADLLQAAVRRFTVLGYERTTTRDIAADAGVNVSLINRYFGSKEGLLAAAMAESADRLAEFRSAQSSITDALLTGLEPDAWPEFGHEHPLTLLLRGVSGDDRVRELRRGSLEAVVARLTVEVDLDAPRSADDAAVRAELVLALVAGVLSVRSTLPEGALATTDVDRLRDALRAITTSILTSTDGG